MCYKVGMDIYSQINNLECRVERLERPTPRIGLLSILLGIFIDARNVKELRSQAIENARIARENYELAMKAHKG